MNGRTLQQCQQNDLLYSPSSPYWIATTAPVLRSHWSTSLKQSPHYGSRNGHSRNKSQSSSQDMDYNDEFTDRQHRHSSHGLTSSSGMHSHHRYYDQEHQQDYGNFTHGFDTQSSSQRSIIHTQQYQQQQPYDVEQSYSRHRRTSLSSHPSPHNFSASSASNNYNMKNPDRLVAIENVGIDHHSHYVAPNKYQGLTQKKLQQQQTAPSLSTSADTYRKSSYRRQEPGHLGHHHYAAHSGWKMSGQCNQSSPRSSLSPTSPSSYDNNSSSTYYTTLSSSSSSSAAAENYLKHRSSNGTKNTNGITYHRRKCSVDRSIQTMDYPHRHKQSILASSTTTSSPPSPSLSSSSGSANYYHQTTSLKPTSTNRYRHSCGDYYNDEQNPWQNSQVERTRRYSQGDSSNTKQQTVLLSSTIQSITTHAPVPRRVSTPKLRRVCSAKPYMEQPPPTMILSQGNGGNGTNNYNNNDDDDLLAATMDAASLLLAKRRMATGDMMDYDDDDDGHLETKEHQATPNFWNPRSEEDIIPVKRTFSRRIRGLLLPLRNKSDATMSKEQQMAIDYQWSLARPLTPVNELSFDNDALLEDQENGIEGNPFYMIGQSWDIADHIGLSFDEDDFIQVDTYASSVQQTDPSLTPQTLSQNVLTRPYRRDLYRLRTLFTWITQNIAIVDQYKSTVDGGQHGVSDDEDTTTTVMTRSATATIAAAGTGSTTTLTSTIQPSKVSFRQRLTTRRNISIYDHEEDLEMPTVNVMHGDGLLPEGGGNVDSFDDWLFSESAQQVLRHRECSSSIGMANLFCEMATAAGCRDVRVVYGYLRAPKDSIRTACMDSNNGTNNTIEDDNDNVTLIQNHAWCCIKVEGEYRFVDCWLASLFQPQNKNKMEPHWFLTKPTDLIYTHFPQESVDQCLEPAIHVTTFFALPYVWASFFTQHIKMIRYNPSAIMLVEDQVCHLVFRVDHGTTCFAFVETDSGGESAATTTMRCLAQSRMVPHENGSMEHIYKVKAVLPSGHDSGWLKIYAGHSPSSTLISNGNISSSSGASTRQDHSTNGSPTTTSLELPPLALCFRLTVRHAHHLGGRLRPFEFVHLHPNRHEFYIREPQCYQLYPLHTYNFFVRGNDMHHKLAIKSPGGKLYKLMYYPQEHTYDGSVKIAEIGKWSLVSLWNHAGGWSVVATWECRA